MLFYFTKNSKQVPDTKVIPDSGHPFICICSLITAQKSDSHLLGGRDLSIIPSTVCSSLIYGRFLCHALVCLDKSKVLTTDR